MKHTVLLAGASGEVGKRLIQNLIADNSVGEIHLLNRRPLHLNHEKVFEHITDFESLNELSFTQTFDKAYCCLGTTIKQAGSQQAFFNVDYTYCLNFAKLSFKHQCRNLSIISSLGANAASNNFYLQTKGKLEQSLQAMDWQSLQIFRPSLLIGDRKEFRLSEKCGGALLQLMASFMIGPLKRYRPIQILAVAKALSVYPSDSNIKNMVIESDQIQKIADQ